MVQFTQIMVILAFSSGGNMNLTEKHLLLVMTIMHISCPPLASELIYAKFINI